ncbi:MAG TPA: type IV toxin-antitoxin system AbiEi family antitoxin domain-containing protein [Jiangellaceae bacterium]|nr:type IV toxin-antitoxin system AbiEi family antitoxin domain-containing protein [Jiangellaceae bacterium]
MAAGSRRAGISRKRLQRLTDDGRLTRLATGIYAPTTEIADLDPWAKFGLRSRAFATAHGPNAYLTGWAATYSWRLPTLGRPPELPTVVRPKAPGRSVAQSSSGRILVADVPASHRGELAGVAVVGRGWAVADLARVAPLPHSLVVADRAVRRGEDLRDALRHMSHWENVGRARWVAEHADPASESPLETLGRFTFIEYNLPMPVSNAWVGRDGPERRLDGLLPWHWVALEGDGAVKYDDRDDATQIIRAQQAREFDLRRLGLDFARYGWPDVFPSRRPWAERIQAVLADHPPGREPVRWWKNGPGGQPVVPGPEDWPSPHPLGIVLPAGWERELLESRRTAVRMQRADGAIAVAA